jgi:hypothetical protein
MRRWDRLIDLVPSDAFMVTLNRCLLCQGAGVARHFAGVCPGCNGEGATYRAFRPTTTPPLVDEHLPAG